MSQYRRCHQLARLLAFAALLAACSDPSSPGNPRAAGPLTAAVVAGGEQAVTVGETLAEDVVVEVRTARGQPAAGVQVFWSVRDPAGGSVLLGSSSTNGEGRTGRRWAVGERAGVYTLGVLTLSGRDTVQLAGTTATALPGPPVTGLLSTPVFTVLAAGDSLRLAAQAWDRFGNPVPDSALAWESTQPLVATVTGGLVRAHAEGVATLRSAAGAGTLRVDLVVRQPGSTDILQLAFGSCNDEDLPQPLWEPIIATGSDLWAWLGDNIYGDTEDMAVLAAKYARQKNIPGYQALRVRMPVVGTWDDHDYGRNNAGREYPMRAQSQQLFLDFFDVPAGDPRRSREGVYSAHTFGPPGRRVKIILLDVRYHRELPGPTSDILGEAQWAWLAEELRGSDADVNLVASGIQVVSEEHPYETWARFPAARERLFRVIGESGARGVLLLSGDRHIGDISRLAGTAAGQPLYDITASGLTHAFTNSPQEPNRHRVAGIMRELHFGLIRFDWHSRRLILQLRDAANGVAFEHVVPLDELR